MNKVLLAASFMFVFGLSEASNPGECSQENIAEAVRVLMDCNVHSELIDLLTDDSSCVDAVSSRFVIKNSQVLGDICRPGTSGDCLSALFERLQPKNEAGLQDMARACRYVSPKCARGFVARYSQFDLKAFTDVCRPLIRVEPD